MCLRFNIRTVLIQCSICCIISLHGYLHKKLQMFYNWNNVCCAAIFPWVASPVLCRPGFGAQQHWYRRWKTDPWILWGSVGSVIILLRQLLNLVILCFRFRLSKCNNFHNKITIFKNAKVNLKSMVNDLGVVEHAVDQVDSVWVALVRHIDEGHLQRDNVLGRHLGAGPSSNGINIVKCWGLDIKHFVLRP